MRSSTIKDAAREAARGVTERAAEQAQVDQLRERLAPVVDHAIQVAREQAAQAAVAAGHARDWAAPRVGAAVERGRLAAAPRVEAAAERVAPAVDAARDRIVEELLPRIVEAVHHASAAGAAVTAAAAENVSRTVEDAALSVAAATPSARARVRSRRRRRARTLWLAITVALAAAGVAAALRKARSRQAAWELAPTGVPAGPATSTGTVTGSAMDVIAAAAGPADAGVATPSTVSSEPVEALEPVVVEDVEPADPTVGPTDAVSDTRSDTRSDEVADAATGPETIGIETGLTADEPAGPRGRRG